MAGKRYLVHPPEKQYIDINKATGIFAASESYEQELCELFDEFMSDQWGHGEQNALRELGDVHRAYEDVTEHFIKQRFGTSQFSDWDGSNPR